MTCDRRAQAGMPLTEPCPECRHYEMFHAPVTGEAGCVICRVEDLVSRLERRLTELEEPREPETE